MSNTKHILINAFSARRGGGQTYLINLLNNFIPQKNIQVSLLLHESSDLVFNNPNIRRINISFNVINPFLRYFWEKFHLPSLLKKEGVDLLFCPGGLVSIGRKAKCKKVTMFRNMIPLDKLQRKKYPIGYMRLRNWLLGFALIRSMEAADVVIFISKYGQKVVQSISNKGIKKFSIIPHGVNKNNQLKSRINSSIKKDNDLFIAYVSTIDVYKSQLEVVEAYHLLNDRGIKLPKLFLIGPWETLSYVEKIKSSIIKKNLSNLVFLKGPVSYKNINSVYDQAEFIIFASKSENCPNILLESMAAGKAIICSNYQPMPEFADEAVLYFNPKDPNELADKILILLKDKEKVKELENKSLERSLIYNWEQSAQETWKILINEI